MQDLRNEFPALNNQIYLNTASSGLLSKTVLDWRRQSDLDFYENGADYLERKNSIEETRATVANFFGAAVNETALVPNFSFGINVILEGVSKGKKVLMLTNDYPSLRWPIETRDFDICYANVDGNLEKNIEQAVAKHKPDIFVFSIVQWLSGIKIDLDFLKQLKAYHPEILLIADGTQYMGTERFNFKDSAVDVLGASAYKWIGAGFGCGFMLVKESAQSKIHPQMIGFNSAETFNSTPTETTFIKHFEPGHQDILNYGSLNQAIKFIERTGIDAISETSKNLSKIAIDKLNEKGLLSESILNRKQHSSIINFSGTIDLFKKLTTQKIVCSPRGGGIRVSFNYYNTIDEIDALMSHL